MVNSSKGSVSNSKVAAAADTSPPTILTSRFRIIGKEPFALYVSPRLRMAMVGENSGVAEEFTWQKNGSAETYRKLDDVYLTWLRRNHTGDRRGMELFGKAVADHAPDLRGARAPVPHNYIHPYDSICANFDRLVETWWSTETDGERT